MYWLSGAMLYDYQSFPKSEDDRRALCQVRSLKEDKETFDDLPFVVATYNFNECDNKEKQKFTNSILARSHEQDFVSRFLIVSRFVQV